MVTVRVPSTVNDCESLFGAEPDEVTDIGSAVKVKVWDVESLCCDILGDNECSLDLESVGVGSGVMVFDWLLTRLPEPLPLSPNSDTDFEEEEESDADSSDEASSESEGVCVFTAASDNPAQHNITVSAARNNTARLCRLNASGVMCVCVFPFGWK
jgi:hypothetical protein